MPARVGPVVLSVQGDEYVNGARIAGIIWEGATTAGDTVEIRERDSGNRIWKGRTDTTNTYLGAVGIGARGVHAPSGFKLVQISAGEVSVYLEED